jgi:hypothetical protein
VGGVWNKGRWGCCLVQRHLRMCRDAAEGGACAPTVVRCTARHASVNWGGFLQLTVAAAAAWCCCCCLCVFRLSLLTHLT